APRRGADRGGAAGVSCGARHLDGGRARSRDGRRPAASPRHRPRTGGPGRRSGSRTGAARPTPRPRRPRGERSGHGRRCRRGHEGRSRRLRGTTRCRGARAGDGSRHASGTHRSARRSPPSGRSRAIDEVRMLVRTAAHTEAHVLIAGETGTSKEEVARAVHGLGRRAAGPFVPVNCAAVPETLAESEFFGHTRGAFTGALQERPGALQLADRGTLFLDEVEDLPLALQAKLLRVVQDPEVRPLGGSVARRFDVRLIAASNRDLARMIEAGTFRSDLYYRLRVFTIQLPPLRQR